MLVNLKGHLVAVAVILVWGTTFVSSKVLLNNGVSPEEIFLARFTLAYFSLLLFSHKRFFCGSQMSASSLVPHRLSRHC